MKTSRLLAILLMSSAAICRPLTSACCTSLIASGKATRNGRPLLWKHRDTGADNNFIKRVEPRQSGDIGFVALFNGGDSLLLESWQGMNDAGFAIMNTASYNLAPDTAKVKDREGIVMTEALRSCKTVSDFEECLRRLPKPLGVQANFGVIDAQGGAAYFETSDYEWKRYDVADAPNGVLIRSNYSFSGEDGTGFGYIRYNTADTLTSQSVAKHDITPELLTETVSRSFYHSLLNRDCYTDTYVVNQDFIPRDISTSSIAIEGVKPGEKTADMRMWAALGYPPCAETQLVTLKNVPKEFQPNKGWRSDACEKAMDLRKSTIPYEGGSGKKYIDMTKLRPINEKMKQKSLENYKNSRKK